MRHLLRVDALITMFASVLTVAGSLRQIQANFPFRTFCALVAIAGVVSGIWVVAAGAVALVQVAVWLRRWGLFASGGSALSRLFLFGAFRPRALWTAVFVIFLAML